MDDQFLINELQGQRIADGIRDPITRNLVMFGIAEARMRVVRKVGQEEAKWRTGVPAAPFDMQFFTSVLSSIFEKRDIIRAVLEGQDLAQASGWDV